MKKILFALILLSACARPATYVNEAQGYNRTSNQIIEACKDARASGRYKTYMQTLDKCEKPAIYNAARAYHFPYMDILDALYAKKAELGVKLDKKQISQKQFDSRIAEYAVHLNTVIAQRDQPRLAQQQQMDRQRQQANSDMTMFLLNDIGNNMQQPAYPPPPAPPITCHGFNNGMSTVGSCY